MSLPKAVAAAALTIALVYVLFELEHALLLLYSAVVLAILFDPAVRRTQQSILHGRWSCSRGAATAIVSIVVAGVLVLIGLTVGPPIIGDAHQLQSQWPEDSARLLGWVHAHLPFSRSLTTDSLSRWGRAITGGSAVQTVGSTAVDVLMTLLLAIYMLADGPLAFNWALSLIPVAARADLRTALESSARRMQGWVAGQGLLMLTHGGSALITFWVLGLPHFLALGVFAAVVNIIPVLGPILTLGAASLVAAINSPGKLLGVAIFYVAYHNAEGIYLQPRIMKSAVGIPGVAVIVALIIGDQIAGIVGTALSVPTAVLIAELTCRYSRGREAGSSEL